jgi:hypothetical protein
METSMIEEEKIENSGSEVDGVVAETTEEVQQEQETEQVCREVEFEEDPAPRCDSDSAKMSNEAEQGETAANQSQAVAENANGEPEQLVDENVEVTVETVIEAILFASDESLTPVRLANMVDSTAGNVNQCVKNLNEKFHIWTGCGGNGKSKLIELFELLSFLLI